jgi:antitoxin VapB
MLHDQPKERTVRIFRNGRSRAVRIPSEFDLAGDEVIIRQEKNGLITIQPIERRRSPREVIEWLRAQPQIDEVFPDIDDGDMLPLDDIKF